MNSPAPSLKEVFQAQCHRILQNNHPTPTLDAFAVFRSLKEQLFELQRQFLEQRGWKYTSNNPGSYWLFVKEVDGTRVGVAVDMAIEIERGLCGERYNNQERGA
jgi:hypothetical protein